jgi:hypothetical protein
MSPRIAQVQQAETVHIVVPAPGRPQATPRNLLVQEAVPMTVLAQDPSVGRRPVATTIPVPAERLAPGPRGHRFAVLDAEPVDLTGRDPWVYVDHWAGSAPEALVADRGFRAQNVFAVAAHTLALVEQYLGRPVPWYGGEPQLALRPQGTIGPAAFYSRADRAVNFGWVPPLDDRPLVFTALNYDVVAHETTHAVLDGLRPRFAEPGLPDQLAFHEALADLVALLSVFTLDGVAERLLEPRSGRVVLGEDTATRAATLMATPLTTLAEGVGPRLGGPEGLRTSGVLEPFTSWQDSRNTEFAEPHRRSEILVAAFLHTLVGMWAGRLEPLASVDGGLDSARVAEEGVKSAEHLLGMLLRSLDYLPPVDLEFADVIDSVLTADVRLAPDDRHHYRDALQTAFAGFGIVPPEHHILDEDGVAAPARKRRPRTLGIRYEHLNLAALRTSPDELYSFLWNNAPVLGVDVGYPTRVERVLTSTRVGPDGLVVTEILADYTQNLRTTVAELPAHGIHPPKEAPPDAAVELWGGGVLVFDQFGRFRLHQRQPLLDARRQKRRLKRLFAPGAPAADPTRAAEPFALLHGVGAGG